jgi:hypothetical protein
MPLKSKRSPAEGEFLFEIDEEPYPSEQPQPGRSVTGGLASSRGPGHWREFRQAVNRDVGQSGQDSGEIVANPDLKAAAGFDDGDDGCHLRPSLRTAQVYPILPVMYTCA